MKTNIGLVKVALCGPSDVTREIEIAQEVITEWNLQHSDAFEVYAKYQHWLTDGFPDLSDRPQAILNRQIIDEADVIVAIFWSRFGTSTNHAGSGTEEEIRRGIVFKKRVMVYFSDLEPLPPHVDADQLSRLSAFRQFLQTQGLCWNFISRSGFRALFQRHIAKAIHEIVRTRHEPVPGAARQSIVGDNNLQAAGSINIFTSPPQIKQVVERRPDSVTSGQQKQIQKWITTLAEGTVGKTRQEAFGEWWSRFKNRFDIPKCEDLPATQMPEAKAWYQQQKAMQISGLRTKAPDAWRTARVRAIKAFMTQHGHTNDTFYPLIAKRLGMKKAFDSLTKLTKRDLERVYNLIMRDSRSG